MINKNNLYYQNSRGELDFLIPAYVKRVLEIGCGEGAFRKNLPKDVEYVGVEPNINSAEIARSICDTILVGTIEDTECKLIDNYFELIIANDVIEHTVDHNQFLRIVNAKLIEGTHFIGSIPNIRSFESIYNLIIRKDWKYTESGILDYTHLRYFTMVSLQRTLKEAGFIDISVVPINNIYPNGRFKLIKMLIIEIVKFLFGRDVGYSQLAFSCRKKSK